MIREAIGRLVARAALGREEAAAAMADIVEGRATDAQIAAFLVALRMKGETVEEIVGCAQAVRERLVRVRCPDPDALDTCGTGGDGLSTFNVSTAAAVVVAAAGLTVAKHGNHGVSSRCGSADLLRAAGVELEAPVERVERCLREARLAFLYAPLYNHGARRAAAPRREIGLRTVFNALGPLANPAGVRRQLVGVYDASLVVPIARALGELGCERGLVVHGADGLDEISPAADTIAAEVRNGQVEPRRLSPEAAGLRRWPLEAIRGGSPEDNLALFRALLGGRGSEALRDAVALNAGAALWVGGAAEGLREGVALAREVLASGRGEATFARVVALSRGEA